jgi:glycosyltransferase involved in cell wall biosynthesis
MESQRRARRRILYVDTAPSVGGSIISLYHLVRGLDRSRYEACVVLRAGSPYAPRFEALGASVYTVVAGYTGAAAPQAPRLQGLRRSGLAGWVKRLPLGERLVHAIGFYLRTWPELQREAAALVRVMRACQPDLVHLNDVVEVSRAGIMAAHAARVPALCHVRALSERTHYDRMISHWLSGFVCISQAVARHESALGGQHSPSWVVYNGVEPADYEPPPDPAAERQALRDELGLLASDYVVGCLGRIQAWKGQHVLIQALALLAERYPQVKVVMVGLPEVHDMAYGETMRELVHGLGLDERVVFAGYRGDVPAVLRAIDLLVHASVSPEPFGRVIIESMAAGTPVVATLGGAVPEIIRDGENGRMVPPGDPAAMAEAMENALLHAEVTRGWASVALADVREWFTVQEYVQGIEGVYQELLNG